MRTSRILILVIVALLIAVNALYWQDPWLWRRFVDNLSPPATDRPELLRPNEVVAGDGSYVLPVAEPATRTVDGDALAAAERFAREMDSFALLVLHRGVIQHEWYGPGWDAQSLTQSQSMHKSLLPLLIGRAMREGAIGSADDPIGRYVEEWRDDPRGQVTLRQLMQMSSGLAQYGFTLNPFTDDFRWLFSGDTLPVVLRIPQLDWPAGTRFDYNNLNAELLGTVIERATGRRYAEYLSEQLWQPMGGTPARVWVDREGGDPFTSCCLMATARDWARLGMLMLGAGEVNGRRLLPESWIFEMVTPTPFFEWYGLQTWLAYSPRPNPRVGQADAGGGYEQSEPFLARDVFYFGGRGAQRVYVVPSRELVIVRLGPALGRNPLKPGWDNSYLVNTVIRGLGTSVYAD